MSNQTKNSLITEDEAIELAINSNNLTSGLDAIENIALNLECKDKKRNRPVSRTNCRHENLIW